MSPIGRTVSCKSPPHLGMHWLRGWRCAFCIITKTIYVITDLESIHQVLSYRRCYEIWFHLFQNLTLGYTIFVPGIKLKVKADLPQTTQLSGRPYGTFTPSLGLIRSKIFEELFFCHYHDLAQFWPLTLTLVIWYDGY
jgi:hypothetical protein